MINPLLALGTTIVVTMNAIPASTAQDAKSLRQVTGPELAKLVVGSTMAYGNDPIAGTGFSVFKSDYHYKFYGSEIWGAEGPYRVENDQIVVETFTPWSFKVFSNNRSQYYILMSNQLSVGYQSVHFHHIRSGKNL